MIYQQNYAEPLEGGEEEIGQAVVPAKAGTQTTAAIVETSGWTAFFETITPCGYGSRPSPDDGECSASSDGQIADSMRKCKPRNQKYSWTNTQISGTTRPVLCPQEGRFAVVTERGAWDAMDAVASGGLARRTKRLTADGEVMWSWRRDSAPSCLATPRMATTPRKAASLGQSPNDAATTLRGESRAVSTRTSGDYAVALRRTRGCGCA